MSGLEKCIAAALEPYLERINELETINAELLAALKLWMSPYLDEHPGFTTNLIEQSRRAIAKAEVRE